MTGWVKGAAVLGILVMASCTTTYRNHGFTPRDEELANIIVGVDTRDTVIETIGVPSALGVTNQAGMYFVSSTWTQYGMRRPRPVDREVVAVSFDGEDVVQNIARYGLEDGQVVTLSRRVSEGGANEISFIRQLMGNVGRVNASDILGAP